MNSICLSVAPNLRCEGLSRPRNIAILIPPAVELIFSLTLAFTRPCDRSRGHWLLVLDGLSFFLLALADLLSHVITQASSTLVVFKIIDFVVAGASFFPIFAYTLFLFYFARSYLITLLPQRFSRIITAVLFATIPPIVVFNELGSLLGIVHRSDVNPATGQSEVQVGFADAPSQRLSLFFSSSTLALLTVFQAAIFSLGFIRLMRAFLDERRVETTSDNPDAPDEVHLFRGLGWLVIGLKLGAIETVVGFANVSFGAVLTRRILRLFARGAIIIGVLKGMNIVEDFVRFETDVKARRNGPSRRSRFVISPPRNSTFHELSPHATTAFNAAQREKHLGPSPLGLGAESSHTAFNTAAQQRVTVHYDGKTPPVLELRLSGLEMPLPPLPLPRPAGADDAWHSAIHSQSLPAATDDIGRPAIHPQSPPAAPDDSLHLAIQPQSPPTATDDTWGSTVHPRSSTAVTDGTWRSPTSPQHPAAINDGTWHLPSSPQPSAVVTDGTWRSAISQNSAAPPRSADSLDAVREMASRFPNLPPRVTPGGLRDPEDDADSDADWRAIARARSLQRRAARITDHAPDADAGDGHVHSHALSPSNSIRRKAAPPVDSWHWSDGDGDSIRTQTATPDLTREITHVSSVEALSPFSVHGGSLFGSVPRRGGTDAEAEHRRRLTRLRRELGADADEDESDGEVPWPHSGPLQAIGEDGEDDDAGLDNVWHRAELVRIKSVSQVRVRMTPSAQQNGGSRGSLFAVEEDLGQPAERWPARLDSGVLGEDDRRFVRQGIYV